MKLVFMGTPDFAVPALQALQEAGHEIALVVTQPDKPKGRSGKLSASEVKTAAQQMGLSIFQPEKIREEAAIKQLQQIQADVFVVAAFGQILPKEVLALPAKGCVNIHASLLPKYRGASPIQEAILKGEEETGVTIMQMDIGCDTGDILMQEALPITKQDTGGSLFERLSNLGARMIVKALSDLEQDAIVPIKQEEALATHCSKIDKASGRINWMKTAEEIDRQIRAFDPWPGSVTLLQGKQLKLWKAEVSALAQEEGLPRDGSPGSIVQVTKDALYVQCKEGILRVTEVQLQGKKRMCVHDFLLGNPVEVMEHMGGM